MSPAFDLVVASLPWPATAVYSVIFVILVIFALQTLLRYWLCDGDGGSTTALGALADIRSEAEAADTIRPEEFPDLKIPKDLHIEIAIDPPCGLQFSNTSVPYSLENEFCTGNFIYFHRPTSSLRTGAGNLNFRKYFDGKKRLWELRFQFRFKKVPAAGSEMFFGFQLEDYVPMNPAIQVVMNVAVGAMRRVVGGIYYSIGDDPEKITGECEKPTIVLPMWAFDQYIETPEGQEPPCLTDINFPQMGKCRKNRIQEYMHEVETLQKNFRVGPTYTFAHWGTSRFADFVNWRLTGLKLAPPLSFKKLTGPSLVRVVLYALKAPQNGTEDSNDANLRHLDSRKDHYFKAAMWNSNERPKRALFRTLTGVTESSALVQSPGPAADSCALRNPFRVLGNDFQKAILDVLSCCTADRREHFINGSSKSN